jgi:hypothetical protein
LAQHCATFFVVLLLLQQLFLTKLFIRKCIKNGPVCMSTKAN